MIPYNVFKLIDAIDKGKDVTPWIGAARAAHSLCLVDGCTRLTPNGRLILARFRAQRDVILDDALLLVAQLAMSGNDIDNVRMKNCGRALAFAKEQGWVDASGQVTDSGVQCVPALLRGVE